MLQLSLEGKVAVVTGAGRGLGQAAAWALSDAGAEVALLARSAAELAETAQRIEERERRALTVVTDVREEQSVDEAANRVIDQLGRVDILVNNAGIARVAPLLEISLSEFEEVLGTNLVGAFLCTRAFGAHMVGERSGVIINIGSIAGVIGEANLAAYSASKGGMLALTRAVAMEWARYGVRCNAIAPGYFHTDLNRAALEDPAVGPKVVRRIPLGRVGQAEELGPLVVYLASDAAAFMTGSVVVLDGGQTAH